MSLFWTFLRSRHELSIEVAVVYDILLCDVVSLKSSSVLRSVPMSSLLPSQLVPSFSFLLFFLLTRAK